MKFKIRFSLKFKVLVFFEDSLYVWDMGSGCLHLIRIAGTCLNTLKNGRYLATSLGNQNIDLSEAIPTATVLCIQFDFSLNVCPPIGRTTAEKTKSIM